VSEAQPGNHAPMDIHPHHAVLPWLARPGLARIRQLRRVRQPTLRYPMAVVRFVLGFGASLLILTRDLPGPERCDVCLRSRALMARSTRAVEDAMPCDNNGVQQ
jgi:hypothetical protein